jgi:hypothetical protein
MLRLLRWKRMIGVQSAIAMAAFLAIVGFVALIGGNVLPTDFATAIAQPAVMFNDDGAASSARNLVMVACHAALSLHKPVLRPLGDDNFYLLPYQRNAGLPDAITAHIKAGLDEALLDPASLLMFSGGESRRSSGPLSEASSYYTIADVLGLWPANSNVRARTITEEYATDSFTNLLYSVCRFKEITGEYPDTITVVSFTFKQARFEDMHAHAIHWPSDRFKYVGLDPPESTGFDLSKSRSGEYHNAAKLFKDDPYGCHSDVLVQKRLERNPFLRTSGYENTCSDIADLLRWCGTEGFEGALPWVNGGHEHESSHH